MLLALILSSLAAAPSSAHPLVQDASDAVPTQVRELLEQVAARTGTTLQPLPGGAPGFQAELTKDLKTCDRIDLRIEVGAAGRVELSACPRVRCAPLDPRKATDGAELQARLEATRTAIAPLAWSPEAQASIHAVYTLDASDANVAQALERALLAARSLDPATQELLAAFPPPLTDEQVTARLREAAADPKQRARILAEIAGYLPALSPSLVAGRSAFEPLELNRRGVALDAFRFRVPLGNEERRLVWAFAYPPGTARSWSIVPLDGDAPRFVRFHQVKLAGTDLPTGVATIVQRTEEPLKAGAEYLIWFEFKVASPVELHLDLACPPRSSSDRDTPEALTAALGLTRAG